MKMHMKKTTFLTKLVGAASKQGTVTGKRMGGK